MMSSLMAVLGLDANPFKRNLLQSVADARHAGREIKEAFGEFIGQNLPFLGAAGAITTLEQIAHRSIEWGEKIANLSLRLGISTDAVQLWDVALRKNGSSIESATGFFEKLATAREKIEKGGKGSDLLIQNFKALGVSLEDLKSKRVEDIAAQIARAFEAGDPQRLIGDLRAVGGRAAGEMVTAFRNGLGEMISPEQTEIHLVSPHDINTLKEMGDEMKTIAANLKGLGASFTAEIWEKSHAITSFFAGAVGGVTSMWDSTVAHVKAAISGKKENPFAVAGDEIKAFGTGFSDTFRGSQESEAVKGELRDKRAKDLQATAEKTRQIEEEHNVKAKEAERTAAEILRIRQETARVQQATALHEMTAAQRVEEIEKRIARVKAEIKDAVDDKDEAQSNLNMAKLQEELGKAKEAETKEEERNNRKNRTHGTARGPEVNELQRIGAFAPAVTQGAAERSERHLMDIKKGIDELNTKGSRTRF